MANGERAEVAHASADEDSRPISAMSMELVTGGYERPQHTHRHAQLILALRGLITCNVAKSRWMVPPQCALSIPGDL